MRCVEFATTPQRNYGTAPTPRAKRIIGWLSFERPKRGNIIDLPPIGGPSEGEGRDQLALREEELSKLCDDVDLDRDRALVERCQAGDSAAFGNLYARYYERLLRFCLRRLNDRHEAEDAAQEAFARAWKALPRFAGERRFYPWLTVIAGNICTDMLRRRSRSMPTDDLELTARQPVGVGGADTSEELVLAAVDGEMVNRALDRLSTRHRQVLAMREGSGWTYQQIADHEGVEIGTIETLLWRARQALKREFAVVSDSKGALAGFLIATGALIRRSVFRVAHRGASLLPGGGASGTMRNAVTGATVTGAVVAAAFIAPHAWSTASSAAVSAPGSALAAPPLAVASAIPGPSGGVGAGATTPGEGAGTDAASGGNSAADGAGNASAATGSHPSGDGTSSTSGGAGSNLGGLVGGASSANGLSGGLGQAAGSSSSTAGGVVSGVGQTAGGVVSGVGQTAGGVVSGVGQTAGGVVSGVNGLAQSLGLGSVLPGSSGASSSSAAAPTSVSTTTTTNPAQGVLGGTGRTVGGLLGGG
jgi:RNA polymerase sigma-70 factor, ECF subfamily